MDAQRNSDMHSKARFVWIASFAACLTLALGLAGVCGAAAADVKILTPPDGAKILARNPVTHLVLSSPELSRRSGIRLETTGQVIEPVVVMEGEEEHVLHYRLPLKPGRNEFTIVPEEQRIELTYQRISADINPSLVVQGLHLFHRDEKLPTACIDCHELDDGEADGVSGMVSSTSCIECHRNVVEKGPWRHSTTINRQCLSCHRQPGESGNGIGFPAAKSKDLCLDCHAGKKRWFSRKSVHGVLELGGCTLCHDPHSSDHRYQLWADGKLEMCITCHGDKQSLLSREEPTPYVHGVISGAGCVACHEPHASDHQFMLHQMTNDLCLGCHPRQEKFKLGHPVARHPVSAPRESLRSGRQLNCASCHNAHGSAHQLMLIETSRGARLCRKCHER